jgi:5-hydroxyisourate hydrolase
VLIKSLSTNSDGRTDELLLDDSNIEVGKYVIVFHVADYFASLGKVQTEPAFLDDIPIHFGIFDATANYHVPLLVSPWSYSTYRGS